MIVGCRLLQLAGGRQPLVRQRAARESPGQGASRFTLGGGGDVGRTHPPHFIFSNKGDNTSSSRHTGPGWVAGSLCLLGSFVPPNPAGPGVAYKGHPTSPLGCARPGRAEVGSPAPSTSRPASWVGARWPQRVAPSPEARAGSGRTPLTGAERGRLEGGRAALRHRLGSRGAPSPGKALPAPSLPRPRPGGGAAGSRGAGGPHQAELANLVVGHKAEDVLDGYDGQRHQRVVLRQLVRGQRRGWGRLGARLQGLRRGRRGQPLGRADGRRGAAVAVAAASFLSHPLLRRRRHLGGLIPSPTARGSGTLPVRHFLPWGRRGGTPGEGAEPAGDGAETRTKLFVGVSGRPGSSGRGDL